MRSRSFCHLSLIPSSIGDARFVPRRLMTAHQSIYPRNMASTDTCEQQPGITPRSKDHESSISRSGQGPRCVADSLTGARCCTACLAISHPIPFHNPYHAFSSARTTSNQPRMRVTQRASTVVLVLHTYCTVPRLTLSTRQTLVQSNNPLTAFSPYRIACSPCIGARSCSMPFLPFVGER